MVHYDVSHQHWKLGAERGGRNLGSWVGLVGVSIFHSLKVVIRFIFFLSQFLDWSLHHTENKHEHENDACIWVNVIVRNFYAQIGDVYSIARIHIKEQIFVEDGDAVSWSCCIGFLVYGVGSQFFISVSVCGFWIKLTSMFPVAIGWINLEELELLVEEFFHIFLAAYFDCGSDGWRRLSYLQLDNWFVFDCRKAIPIRGINTVFLIVNIERLDELSLMSQVESDESEHSFVHDLIFGLINYKNHRSLPLL